MDPRDKNKPDKKDFEDKWYEDDFDDDFDEYEEDYDVDSYYSEDR